MSRPPQPPKPPHGMTEKAARKFVDATVARYGAGSALARGKHTAPCAQRPNELHFARGQGYVLSRPIPIAYLQVRGLSRRV